jgi:hypothetical protein
MSAPATNPRHSFMVGISLSTWHGLTQEATTRGMRPEALASDALDAWLAETRCQGHVQACPQCGSMTDVMVLSTHGKAQCLACTGRENAAKRRR